MAGKPVGSEVGLTYETGCGFDLEPGQFVRTETGRSYVITAARRVRTARARGRGVKWALRCVVLAEGSIPEDGVVHELLWNVRQGGSGTA